jgi:hypothetical protein
LPIRKTSGEPVRTHLRKGRSGTCLGVLPDRPFDVLGLGAARGEFSSALTPELSDEAVLDLGNQIRLGRSFSLQPTWGF